MKIMDVEVFESMINGSSQPKGASSLIHLPEAMGPRSKQLGQGISGVKRHGL